LNEQDRAASRIADRLKQRGPDPVPAQPPGLGVPEDEWAVAWSRVLLLGLRVTDSLARAEDIRQEAYLRLITTRRWDRDRHSFLKHMLLVATSILKHGDKARARRTHYEAEAGAEYKRERGVTTPSPEHDMLEHAENERSRDFAVRALAELRRKLAGFPVELRLVDHAEQLEARDEELEKPAELAKAMGVRVEEVYRALARIRRYKESVYAAVRGSSEESSDGDEA
jgi:DNA-directed RNA polymerase specialized sigma24 family protein